MAYWSSVRFDVFKKGPINKLTGTFILYNSLKFEIVALASISLNQRRYIIKASIIRAMIITPQLVNINKYQ